MLRVLRLTNWQCHETLTLRPDPYSTVLVGGNGTGKSAVIRALKWLALNEWDGKADAFITWGKKFASAEAWTDRGYVQRYKGEGGNYYLVNKQRFDFDQHRKAVPPEVLAVLNVAPESFQDQRDTGFWFSLSAGQAAKALNRIVNLEEIDNDLDRINSEVRNLKTREKLIRERLAEAESLRTSFAWAADADRRLRDLEAEDARIGLERARLASAGRVMLEVSRAVRVRDNAATLVLEGRRLLAGTEKVNAERFRLDYASRTLEEITRLEARKAWLAKTLSTHKGTLTRHMTGQCPLCGK